MSLPSDTLPVVDCARSARRGVPPARPHTRLRVRAYVRACVRAQRLTLSRSVPDLDLKEMTVAIDANQSGRVNKTEFVQFFFAVGLQNRLLWNCRCVRACAYV